MGELCTFKDYLPSSYFLQMVSSMAWHPKAFCAVRRSLNNLCLHVHKKNFHHCHRIYSLINYVRVHLSYLLAFPPVSSSPFLCRWDTLQFPVWSSSNPFPLTPAWQRLCSQCTWNTGTSGCCRSLEDNMGEIRGTFLSEKTPTTFYAVIMWWFVVFFS